MKKNIITRRVGSRLGRSFCFNVLLITVGLFISRGLMQAQSAVDYDALFKAVRNYPPAGEATGAQPPPAQIPKQDKALYENAMAAARREIAAGDYAKAVEWTTMVLQAWPGDPAATELLAQAQKGPPAPAMQAATPAQPEPVPPASVPPESDLTATTPPALEPPKATKHEISASVDLLLGEGTVTLPVGYSLAQSLPGTTVPQGALEADRSSTYYGATLSYSYGQAWYLDLSYANGESSGSQDINGLWLGQLPSEFEISDTWYQAYVRYTFPSLRGKRFSAYLRAGVSFVQSDLTIDSSLPNGGRYNQTDETQDQLGNLGFGMAYWLYKSPRVRLALQMEGEGFYGTRSQDSLEKLSTVQGITPATTSIDNTLYGGIARATLRLELPLGQSGLFKVYMDGGIAGRFTTIDYPDATISDSATSELLWGPYIKLGLRYAF